MLTTLHLNGPKIKGGHSSGPLGKYIPIPRTLLIINKIDKEHNSDPTGFSLHADFQNGWETVALQNAIDYCNNPDDPTGSGDTAACSYLTVDSASQANTCKSSPVFSEPTGGNLTYLPG